MSNKIEQMNIRLSAKLKDKIQGLAKDKEMKTSDFVRQTLEEAIEGKSRHIEEDELLSDFSSRERHMLQAVAFIAHTDTGRDIVDCMKIALELAGENFKNMASISNLTRGEAENQAMQLNDLASKKLQVSPLAVVFIRIIILTFFGFTYEQNIFELTPLSISTMEAIKEQLDLQNKMKN